MSEWHGIYMVKQGIYSDAILKFRMDFPQSYPKQMPQVVFQSQVFHPLVDPPTKQLRLQTEFNEWKVGANWIIQVLLYIKKIFHIEEYYSLGGEKENAWNLEALNLYTNNFQRFVDRCTEGVEMSIKEKFSYNENVVSFRMSEPNQISEKIVNKIMDFKEQSDDFKTKEDMKNWFKHNLPDQIRCNQELPLASVQASQASMRTM